MSVRNPNKPIDNSPVRRKVFRGDRASTETVVVNPPPTTARGKRRAAGGVVNNPKVPQSVLKGLAHRPHTSGKAIGGANVRGHGTSEDYVKWVLLTKTYKKG